MRVIKGVNAEQQAKLLIEKTGSGDPKVSTVATRMLLQVFSVPSLQAYLSDFAMVPLDNGSYQLQFDFMRLPEDALAPLQRLLSVDYFKDHRFVKFLKNGQARTGLAINVNPDDIPGTAYDYAM